MTKKTATTAPNNITLGATVRDSITGHEGVVTGICEYISGCNQALVQPRGLTKEGKTMESYWFDLQRLVVIPKPVIRLNNSTTPGPDKPAPKR